MSYFFALFVLLSFAPLVAIAQVASIGIKGAPAGCMVASLIQSVFGFATVMVCMIGLLDGFEGLLAIFAAIHIPAGIAIIVLIAECADKTLRVRTTEYSFVAICVSVCAANDFVIVLQAPYSV